MIPSSDDLYSVFLADLSETERERVRSYADKFGIDQRALLRTGWNPLI